MKQPVKVRRHSGSAKRKSGLTANMAGCSWGCRGGHEYAKTRKSSLGKK